MLDSKTLDYIILALILAIAIVMLMNFFGLSCKIGKENMGSIIENTPEQSQNVPSKQVCASVHDSYMGTPDDISIGAPLSSIGNSLTESCSSLSQSQLPKMESINEQIQPKTEEAVNKLVKLQQEYKKSANSCPLTGTPYENDRYIREFVLNGKFDCTNKPEEKHFTRAEIVQCQNQMLDFNDKINGSSNSGVNTVDKLNEIQTSGNNQMIGCEGKTISSIYDGLTQSMVDKRKNCVNQNCLIPPQIDTISKTADYVVDAQFGKSLRDGLMFETDTVSNGSKFYDNVEAYDSKFESNMVWGTSCKAVN